MTFSTAIQQHGPAHARAQAGYQQCVQNANVLMIGIASSGLPILGSPPSNWADFVSTYEALKAEAQAWFDEVSVSLIDVPDDIRTYDADISLLLATLAQDAAALAADPANATLAGLFETNLSTLSDTFATIQTFIAGCADAIGRFNDSLPAMTADLQSLTTQFSTEVSADQAAIGRLQQSIAALQSAIASLTAQVASEALALDAAILVARFTPAWTPATVILKIVATAAVAALTYVIATDTAEIASDLAEVKAAGDALNGASADVAACQLEVTSLSGFATNVSSVQAALQTVLQAWRQLQGEITAAVTDARKAAADASSPDFAAVAADLADASGQWKAVYAEAGTLGVTLDVTSAVLSYGMSSDAIGQAIAAGTTTGIQQAVGADAP